MELTMKKLLLLAIILFSSIANAVTLAPSPNIVTTNMYEVSKQGNDSNPCTPSRPCLTLAGATAKVTKPNSIIYVRNGTYDETVKSNVAVGVTVWCQDPNKTTIRPVAPFPTGIEDHIFTLFSNVDGVFGNQAIMNCDLTGNSRYGRGAISIKGRSNVSVLYNKIRDFEDHGVDFHGVYDDPLVTAVPNKWATGNKFNYNECINSATFSGYGRGCLQVGGQDGMEIIGNFCRQQGRGGANTNGWCIKYLDGGGFSRGKILYNDFLRDEINGDSFKFDMEFLHITNNTEVAYNRFGGALDVNSVYSTDGGSVALDYHDNIVGPDAFISTCKSGTLHCLTSGLILEFSSDGVMIRNNTFKNMTRPLIFEGHNGGVIFKNISFINNVAYNICSGVTANMGGGVNEMYNLKFIGNTLTSASNTLCDTNIGLFIPTPAGGTRNVMIVNNIIKDFNSTTSAPIFVAGGRIDELLIDSNLFFNNGFSNNTWLNNVVSTNTIELNTVKSDPLFNNGSGLPVTAGSFVVGKKYTILTFGTTNFSAIGGGAASVIVKAPSIQKNRQYQIVAVGTTDFTAIGASANTTGTVFTATASGLGTGTAIEQYRTFTATGVGSGTGTAVADDFTLDAASPARTTGRLHMNVIDRSGRRRFNATTSIGAYDY
jgi:hypothetical protein